ncbi:sulfotransferase family protein [Maridesulfovibrio sp.]|uniref:sulfotransferase family protein n=1 Tax=Maridesulfovibrio sp. TaxID=2795000 RepID=UPI0039F02094
MFNKILMINGVPRSGTSWLGAITDSSRNVRYKFQPFYSWGFRETLSQTPSLSEMHRFFLDIYNTEDWYLDQINLKREGLYPVFSNKNDRPETLAVKSVRRHYLLPQILKLHPDVKLACIIRNPIECLCSWSKSKTMFSKGWDILSEWEFAQSINEFSPDQYFGFNRWKEANMMFLHLHRQYPEKVHIINYKDLVSDCRKQTEILFQFAGIKFESQTDEFISASQQTNKSGEYSVYKSGARTTILPEQITNRIREQLNGTILEKYVD